MTVKICSCNLSKIQTVLQVSLLTCNLVSFSCMQILKDDFLFFDIIEHISFKVQPGKQNIMSIILHNKRFIVGLRSHTVIGEAGEVEI